MGGKGSYLSPFDEFTSGAQRSFLVAYSWTLHHA